MHWTSIRLVPLFWNLQWRTKHPMSKKKRKYLIETSAIPVALAESTPKHCQHFEEEIKDGELYSSIYIRMEFIRRWICEHIRIALTIAHFENVHDALTW